MLTHIPSRFALSSLKFVEQNDVLVGTCGGIGLALVRFFQSLPYLCSFRLDHYLLS